MEESVETEIIYFSSGLQWTFVTGPEWPKPLARKPKLFRPSRE